MKKINLKSLIIAFVISVPMILSAQNKKPIQFIAGVSNTFELAYQNTHSNNFTNTPGLFAEIKGKRISSETSLSYAERYNARDDNSFFGFCGVGLNRTMLLLLSSEESRVKAIQIDQLFKFYLINKKNVSYFIGGGGLLRLPQKMEIFEINGEIQNLELGKDQLDKMWGYKILVGFDYNINNDFHISTQLGLNKLLMVDGYRHYYFPTNEDNVFMKISLGYQLN